MGILKRLSLGVALASCCLLGSALPGFAQTAAPVTSQDVATLPPGPEDTTAPQSVDDEEAKASREIAAARPLIEQNLMRPDFTYPGGNMLDPFVSFIVPQKKVMTVVAPVEEEEGGELPPEVQRPLTPLQKMSLGEIEGGLKAIIWGDLGRKAVIEDSAGKGYIVAVGTPAGDNRGVITQIFNDRLVIQQEVWEGETKRVVPLNTIVKLKKRE